MAPADLGAVVAASAARDLGPARRIAVALSGGRDSVALLHALAGHAANGRCELSAVHVHHGLSAYADDWAAFCARTAAAMDIPLTIRHVHVASPPRASLEANARAARYRALREVAGSTGAEVVALAHHADDQAETLLLQLCRGAGPAGVAAMPVVRHRQGLAWWRPLLDTPRSAVARYLHTHALRWIDDDSNAYDRHRRNALRQHVVPALQALAPGYPAPFARSAALQADAAGLLDVLASMDARAGYDGQSLSCATLAALPADRARNVLRWFLRGQGLRAPSFARLADMLTQLAQPRADARTCIAHDGAEVGVHGARIHVHAPVPPPYAVRWSGEARLALPHGTLRFDSGDDRAQHDGALVLPLLGRARLDAGQVIVRSRLGGERFTPDAARPRRALKHWLQAAALPPWERAALPLVFCGEQLVAVPGIGVDDAFKGHAGAPTLSLTWQPHAPFARARGALDHAD